MDNKYTKFIENYLENDKTKSAIMLIGGWGTGKSYYIQNVLKPYLEDKNNDCCIIVSLYGLNDLKDISKAIYFEARTKKLISKIAKPKILQEAESQASAKIVGKTIAKGITSFFNIDLTGNEEDLQSLYESIDLSGKLIILEDLERSNIPIKTVLGYVNNLVEQDGVKVLLVANEEEILKRKAVVVGKDENGEEKNKWEWTEETEEYLRIKEKTISDTIPYVCDYFETIENILNQFKDETIEVLLVDKLGELEKKDDKNTQKTDEALKIHKQMLYQEMISLAGKISDLNFRSLIFACQKTVDILRLYNEEIDRIFVKYLFMSIVAFSFKLKIDERLYWDDNRSANSLGTRVYPLYKFAYDYIKYQTLDIEKIKDEEDAFLAHKKAETVQNDAKFYLDILYDFRSTTSVRLELAVREIKGYLETLNVISEIVYGKLANYLVIARGLIDDSSLIDDCKEIMKRNLRNGNYDVDKVSDRLTIHDSFRFWMEEQEQEYNEFIAEMKSIIKNKSSSKLDFDYETENIDVIIKTIRDNRDDYVKQYTFLKRVDVTKLIDMIKQCNSQQIDDLRININAIYSYSSISEYFREDKLSIIELKNGVSELLLSESNNGDKIKAMQLSWFVDSLENILKELS